MKGTPSTKPAQSRRASRADAQANAILDLRSGVFERPDPAAIASTLKRIAQRQAAGDPYRSAMGMLTAYIRREGPHLPRHRQRILELAKQHLRAQFHRPAA